MLLLSTKRLSLRLLCVRLQLMADKGVYYYKVKTKHINGNMKQKIMIAVCALLLTPSAAMAQYPQLSGEGAARIDSMKKAWERHADEAWT